VWNFLLVSTQKISDFEALDFGVWDAHLYLVVEALGISLYNPRRWDFPARCAGGGRTSACMSQRCDSLSSRDSQPSDFPSSC
jgi:hypothetical protein